MERIDINTPLRQFVMEAINGESPFVLDAPIISELSARVFISYPHAHDNEAWAEPWAHEIYCALRKENVECFWDQRGIREGSNWYNELNQAMGEANVVIVLLGSEIFSREWCARELETALRNSRLAGVPDIIVLKPEKFDKNPTTCTCYPVFRAILDQKDTLSNPKIRKLLGETPPLLLSPPYNCEEIDARPAKSNSVRMLVNELKTYRFSQTNAIVPHNLEGMVHAIVFLPKSILFLLGLQLGTIVGWIAILLAILQFTGLINVQGFLTSRGLLVPVFLLCGFWAGFVGRLAVSSKFEAKITPGVFEESTEPEEINELLRYVWVVHSFMAVGYLALLMLWLPGLLPLQIAWGIVLIGIGWQTANSAIFHILQGKREIRRNTTRDMNS
jgi:hypothetical protein